MQKTAARIQIGEKKKQRWLTTSRYNNQRQASYLNNLVDELCVTKDAIRDFSGHHISNPKKQWLVNRKDELILRIQKELKKVSKRRARQVRRQLWNELGIVI